MDTTTTTKPPKIWKTLIILSISFSLFSLSIDFHLIEIDKLIFWSKGDTKSIIDNSIMINSPMDIYVKNSIDSNISVDYSKNVQILNGELTRRVGLTNNRKINYHNIIEHDEYGNTFFIRDLYYNQSIWYAECNEDHTYCAVYSNFTLKNNEDREPCFERNTSSSKDYDGYTLGKYIFLKHFFDNPEECVTY